MNFESILKNAKRGDPSAIQKILDIYQPMLIKNSYMFGHFSPDCYQTLVEHTLIAIRNFKIPDDIS